MTQTDTDLPFGDAFSPSQLETDDNTDELVYVLEMVDKYEGRPSAFDDAIGAQFFPDSNDTAERAKLVRLGLKPNGYQLVDDDFHFTNVGTTLYETRHDVDKLYEEFARHILLTLDGLKVIQVIEDLQADADRNTTMQHIKAELRAQYDIHIDDTSNHWSQMRAWLSKADLINTNSHIYNINHNRMESLVGVNFEARLELADLTTEQQAFLRALALIDPARELPNTKVVAVAEDAYNIQIEQSNITRRILNPLQDAGYITHRNPTEVTGKPRLVEPTAAFDADILQPILENLSDRAEIPRDVLRLSFSDIETKLTSEDRHEKGRALEAFAIKIGRRLGLEFSGWRLRGPETGGSEIDVIMDRTQLTFTRWQLQCKYGSRITLDQIAREIGIAQSLGTTTIVMLSLTGITESAYQFAEQLMQDTNLSIILIEFGSVSELRDPEVVTERLEEEAAHAKRLKRLSTDTTTVSSADVDSILDRHSDDLEPYRDDDDEDQVGLDDF